MIKEVFSPRSPRNPHSPSSAPEEIITIAEQAFNDMHPSEFWFTELHTPHFGVTFRVREHLAHKKTPYQTINIFDTYEMGRMLTIDGLVMTSERDEAAYHEMMVHVPMLTHPNPQNVLIIGGGDGGCLKEVVKHPQLEKVVQVEIDEEVINLCRTYLPGIASAYDHPKAEIIIRDAVTYLKDGSHHYDVIILDGSDPIGPAVGLFQEEFIQNIYEALNSGGLVSGQIGSPFLNGERVRKMMTILKRHFADAALYLVHTPTYLPGLWALFLACKDQKLKINSGSVRCITFQPPLKYYTKSVHLASFALPKYIADLVEQEQPDG